MNGLDFGRAAFDGAPKGKRVWQAARKWLVVAVATLGFNLAGASAALTGVDIGNPADYGETLPGTEAGSYTLYGGGADIWGGSDQFHFGYAAQSGDFDVRVRVASLTRPDNWTKAGIMIRESVGASSRNVFVVATPDTGQNEYRFAWRGTDVSGNSNDSGGGKGAPTYPDAWLRLRRMGDTIIGYRGADGLRWVEIGRQNSANWPTTPNGSGALAQDALLGLAVTSHNNGLGQYAMAEVFSFSATPQLPLEIAAQPQSLSAVEHGTATFTVGVFGHDPFQFQWSRNGAEIPGATASNYTIPRVELADNGATFSVTVKNTADGQNYTLTSDTVTLSVTADTTPPAVVSAVTKGNPNAVVVTFSEPVNDSALDAGRYTISNGVAVTAAASGATPSQVILTTSTMVEFPTVPAYELTITGVQDQALTPNTISPNPSTLSFKHLQGFVINRLYRNQTGTSMAALRAIPGFPDSPTVYNYPTMLEYPRLGIEIPANFDVVGGGPDTGSDYGLYMNGYITAPVTGDYVFYHSSDDNGEFWLSTDSSPANKTLIMSEAGWNSFRNWEGTKGGRAQVKSSAIPLVAGQKYYFESLFKEGGGGDYVSVTWQLPGDPAPVTGAAPITSDYLSASKTSGPVTIVADLTSLSVKELDRVEFRVEVDGTPLSTDGAPPYQYEWTRNGQPIAGVNSHLYLSPAVKFSEAGKIQVKVSNAFSSATSSEVTLAVEEDVTPPGVLTVRGNEWFDKIRITLTEGISAASATAAANYAISGGLTIQSIAQPQPNVVVLNTSAQTPNTVYNVTLNNLEDLSEAKHKIAPNTVVSVRSFVYSTGFWKWEVYTNLSGTGTNEINNLRNNPRFISETPDEVRYFTGRLNSVDKFGSDPGFGVDFAGMVSGFFVPNQSGDYRFFFRSDDAGEFWLSTDATRENLARIAFETSYGGVYYEPPNDRTSEIITLVAGQKYYFRGFYKEGGGGDHIRIAYRMEGNTTAVGSLGEIPSAELAVYADPTGVEILFEQALADMTILENRLINLGVVAQASTGNALAYQWFRDGTAISGATGANYTTPVLTLADNGTKFGVQISTVGLSQLFEMTVTILADAVAPNVLGAGSLDGTHVDILFDELLDPVSAAQASNYTIAGATVTGAVLNPDGRSVTLTVSNLPDPFTVTVTGVKDKAGILIVPGASASGIIQGLVGADLGTVGTDPRFPGVAFTSADNEIVLQADGSDIWNNADGAYYVAEQVTGDFDVRVQVASLTRTDHWTKAGIMAREDLTAGSRHLMVVATPVGGQNSFVGQRREVADAASTRWPGPNEVFGPQYPNAWVRLQREGDLFTAYYGSDGVTWTQLAQSTLSLPTTTYLGLTLTSHSIGNTATAVLRNYSATPAPHLSITSPGHDAALDVGAPVTVEVVVEPSAGAQVSKVEFFANKVKISEDSTAPYTAQFTPADARYHWLTAIVTDTAGNKRTSSARRVVAGTVPRVWFITQDATGNASDQRIRTLIESEYGLSVTVVDDNNDVPDQAWDYDLILNSATVGSGNVLADYLLHTVPVINWEQANLDDFDMTGNTDGTHRGTQGGQTELNIVDPAHPLAAGLSAGRHVVANNAVTFTWGLPVAGATVVAEIAGNASRKAIFVYEKDSMSFGGFPMPEMRIQLFIDTDTYAGLNWKGINLVSASIAYALGIDPVLLPEPVTEPLPGELQISVLPNGQVEIGWTGGGRLQVADDVIGAAWTDAANQGNPQAIQPAASRKFYRLIQ